MTLNPDPLKQEKIRLEIEKKHRPTAIKYIQAIGSYSIHARWIERIAKR